MTMSSIPEIAMLMLDDVPKSGLDTTTLIILGSKYVGKTSLLQSLLEKTEQPKETLVLEYSFARKTNQRNGIAEKSVCHLWEFGGKINMLKAVLSSIPMRGKVTFCVMIDLSKIKSIWNILEICLEAIEGIAKMEGNDKVETIIIGGKYDIFKNYDNDTKKLVTTTLRSVALLKNCHLFYYSLNEQPLLRRAKEILNGVTFGNAFPIKDKVAGSNKPLFIPKCTDSWGSIGINSSTIDQIKSRHLLAIPLEVESEFNTTFATTAPTTHFEHQLDSIFKSKYEELQNIASYDINLTDCL